MQKNIIIVGYPKSGTTWLSRLVADLISCPLQGDWGFEDVNAPYKEGVERESQFQCFKSHHTYPEIKDVSKNEIFKIIYIIRDPRDVVLSGAHYFNFLPRLLSKKDTSGINRSLLKTYNKLVSFKEKKRQMIQAVINGNKKLNPWLDIPWHKHYSTFENQNILIIKYEDLIDAPEKECENILNYLNVKLTKEEIKNSISKQSFQNRKIKDANKTDEHQKKLLRKGDYGYWKDELSKKEISFFNKKLKEPCTFYDFNS